MLKGESEKDKEERERERNVRERWKGLKNRLRKHAVMLKEYRKRMNFLKDRNMMRKQRRFWRIEKYNNLWKYECV